jgi:ribonucleoside-diphosphate reductase alpha chain
MFEQDISFYIWGDEAAGKYRLRSPNGDPIDKSPEDTCFRVAKALASVEKTKDLEEYWLKQFNTVIGTKFAGGGRIMANAGANEVKKEVSLINCVVASQIGDSMKSILRVASEAALILKAGCGIGYDFSTIRPKGAYVFGAGAATSGAISFMKIFDSICATVMSGGGRRGAQMGCLDIAHPEILDFIDVKRQDGILRYFNLSILVSDKFMQAVKNNLNWDLWFWEKNEENHISEKIKVINKNDIPYNYADFEYFSFDKDHVECLECGRKPTDIFKKKVFNTLKAVDLYDKIMKSTYDYGEPGFILIDKMNIENNLWFIETIRATNPCGEQPLPPGGCCLLGSMILPPYVKNSFTNNAYFDFELFEKDIEIAARALDNVVEIANLPLPQLTEIIKFQRRHGMGFTGLGSALNMLCLKYGSIESIDFAEKIAKTLAQINLLSAIKLAKEKGPAPFANSNSNRIKFIESKYNQRLLDSFGDDKNKIIEDIIKYGVRWSHGTSLAPTGTFSSVWGNYCSNGLEPVFMNSTLRNMRVQGNKTKIQVEVNDYSFLLWKKLFNDKNLPDYWSTTENITVDDHINIQAVIQKYIDSACSKTINIPSDYPFEDFKEVYIKGYELGLKGITTFRWNPSGLGAVLVSKQVLKNTKYIFVLEDGTEIVASGTDQVEYDGHMHVASNLFDALKEGIYGNM